MKKIIYLKPIALFKVSLYKIFCIMNILFLSTFLNAYGGGIDYSDKNLSENLQQMTVTGIVTDSQTGAAMPGVNVVLKGTNIGIISDANGKFSIALTDKNAILVFSFIGYTSVEIPVAGRSVIDVALVSDLKTLEEVVVVGYGVQKKTSLTAAVSSVKGESLKAIPASTVTNSLGGRMSGLIVRQNSGEPGKDDNSIYIRGIATRGNTSPLLIVDDIPRSFQQLDPNTIASITILKDAAAVAPYGVAGANGVILVTTKRGKAGLSSLTVNSYVGFQNPTILPDWVDAYQWATLKNAAAEGAGLPIPYSDEVLQKYIDHSDPDAYPDPNPYDLINRNAVITNHNIEFTGGSEKFSFYTSLGYQYQAGMYETVHSNKYNLVINLDAQATKTTKVSMNVIGRNQQNIYPGATTNRIFELLAYMNPSRGPVYFSNGMPGDKPPATIYNSGYQKNNTMSLYSQLSIEQELPFIPGLKLKGTIAYDPSFNLDKLWRIPLHMGAIDKSKQPYVITDMVFDYTLYTLDETIRHYYQIASQANMNYIRSFGRNNVSALVVFEVKGNRGLSLGASRKNYSIIIDEISMGSSSQADMTTSGTSTVATQMGVVYRLNYDYSNKYLFEASGRYDGSYYFAPGMRFGFFPAFSIGWRLSEENFIKQNFDWINNLKIRGSYGESGALAGTPFQYLSTYNAYGPAYVIGGNATQGLNERSESNPGITWERAKKTNIGFDVTLLKGLFSLEADYFYEKRSNMLVAPDVVVPLEYGIGLSQVNGGIMKNQGIDFSVNSVKSFSKDFQLSLGVNMTYAKNTLLQIFETSSTYNNPNRRLTGRSLNSRFGYESMGFFQTSDFDESGNLNSGIAVQPWGKVQPGDIRYRDINGDGKINDDDLTHIGESVTPQIIYGIVPNIIYKGLSLDLLFQGAGKSSYFLNGSTAWPFYNNRNAYVDNLDYWTPDNTNAKNPRITAAPTTNNTQTSSFWVRPSNYLRLKSATLAYEIPADIARRIKMQKARIYVAAQNLITWSKIPNYDPETLDGYTNYPQQRVVSIGLNVTF